MKTMNDTPFAIGTMATRIDPAANARTVVVKGTFDLNHGKVATVAQDQAPLSVDRYLGDDRAHSLVYEDDFAPFKPRADLLLVGRFYAPRGAPVAQSIMAFRVGAQGRTLAVFGPRTGRDGADEESRMSAPEPVASLDLTYENALGGPGDPRNPVGLGPRPDRPNAAWALPRIEDPRDLVTGPGSRPAPAGFGPLRRDWDARASLAGEYAADWFEHRYPLFHDDCPWDYFNAAPPEMQVEGYLRGDEALVFENLHASFPRYESQLPSLRLRCFLADDAEGFEEVTLHLDTLWVDMETERLVLVWRGSAEAEPEEELEVFVVAEDLGEPAKPIEHYEEIYFGRREEEVGDDEAEAPEEPDEEGIEADIAALFSEAGLDSVEFPPQLLALAAGAEPPGGDLMEQAGLGHLDPGALAGDADPVASVLASAGLGDTAISAMLTDGPKDEEDERAIFDQAGLGHLKMPEPPEDEEDEAGLSEETGLDTDIADILTASGMPKEQVDAALPKLLAATEIGATEDEAEPPAWPPKSADEARLLAEITKALGADRPPGGEGTAFLAELGPASDDDLDYEDEDEDRDRDDEDGGDDRTEITP